MASSSVAFHVRRRGAASGAVEGGAGGSVAGGSPNPVGVGGGACVLALTAAALNGAPAGWWSKLGGRGSFIDLRWLGCGPAAAALPSPSPPSPSLSSDVCAWQT